MKAAVLVLLLAITGCAGLSSTKSRERDYPAVVRTGCGTTDGPTLDVSIDVGDDEVKFYVDESGYSALGNRGKLAMDSASLSTSELSITICRKGATNGCHFADSGELEAKHVGDENFSGRVNYVIDGTAHGIDFHSNRWIWPGGFCG